MTGIPLWRIEQASGEAEDIHGSPLPQYSEWIRIFLGRSLGFAQANQGGGWEYLVLGVPIEAFKELKDEGVADRVKAMLDEDFEILIHMRREYEELIVRLADDSSGTTAAEPLRFMSGMEVLANLRIPEEVKSWKITDEGLTITQWGLKTGKLFFEWSVDDFKKKKNEIMGVFNGMVPRQVSKETAPDSDDVNAQKKRDQTLIANDGYGGTRKKSKKGGPGSRAGEPFKASGKLTAPHGVENASPAMPKLALKKTEWVVTVVALSLGILMGAVITSLILNSGVEKSSRDQDTGSGSQSVDTSITSVDDSPVDDSPVDDSPVDDSAVDDSPVDDSPVDDSSVGDPSVDDDSESDPVIWELGAVIDLEGRQFSAAPSIPMIRGQNKELDIKNGVMSGAMLLDWSADENGYVVASVAEDVVGASMALLVDRKADFQPRFAVWPEPPTGMLPYPAHVNRNWIAVRSHDGSIINGTIDTLGGVNESGYAITGFQITNPEIRTRIKNAIDGVDPAALGFLHYSSAIAVKLVRVANWDSASGVMVVNSDESLNYSSYLEFALMGNESFMFGDGDPLAAESLSGSLRTATPLAVECRLQASKSSPGAVSGAESRKGAAARVDLAIFRQFPPVSATWSNSSTADSASWRYGQI